MSPHAPDADATGAEGAHAIPPHPPPDEVSLWLVDGYNVLHTVLLGGEDRTAFWTSTRREALLARVAGLVGLDAAKRRVVVVFDGARPHPDQTDDANAGTPHGAALTHRFEPSADAWIVQAARRSERPAEIGVVTSDRQVAGRCRHAGAHVVAPSQFLAWCPEPIADAP